MSLQLWHVLLYFLQNNHGYIAILNGTDQSPRRGFYHGNGVGDQYGVALHWHDALHIWNSVQYTHCLSWDLEIARSLTASFLALCRACVDCKNNLITLHFGFVYLKLTKTLKKESSNGVWSFLNSDVIVLMYSLIHRWLSQMGSFYDYFSDKLSLSFKPEDQEMRTLFTDICL